MTVPTEEERAAFDLEQLRWMGDFNCSHDQAWLDAWLIHERRATVNRIRKQLGETTPRGSMGVDWLVLLRVLDEEANGR